jgi:hypothetical protein
MSTLSPAAARGKSSQVLRLTIAAGASETIRATGSRFYVCESPVRLRIKADQGSAADYGQGCGLSCTDGAFFECLEVANPAQTEVGIVLYVGFADYVDQRSEVMEPPSRFVAHEVAIPANSGYAIPANLQANDIRRKAVVVSNGDATSLRLLIRDIAGKAGCLVESKETAVLEVSGFVEVYNPNPVAVQMYASEVYWVLAN